MPQSALHSSIVGIIELYWFYKSLNLIICSSKHVVMFHFYHCCFLFEICVGFSFLFEAAIYRAVFHAQWRLVPTRLSISWRCRKYGNVRILIHCVFCLLSFMQLLIFKRCVSVHDLLRTALMWSLCRWTNWIHMQVRRSFHSFLVPTLIHMVICIRELFFSPSIWKMFPQPRSRVERNSAVTCSFASWGAR